MGELTQKNINKISQEDWKELFKLIPEIENTNVFGEMTTGEKTLEGVSVFPYMISSEIVSKFHDVVYDKKWLWYLTGWNGMKALEKVFRMI
jgi:hypothetical protein